MRYKIRKAFLKIAVLGIEPEPSYSEHWTASTLTIKPIQMSKESPYGFTEKSIPMDQNKTTVYSIGL